MNKIKQKAKFIEKILIDYDLVETDKDCLNNISGALLEATNYKEVNELCPVGGAGEYYCEEEDCSVVQYEDSKKDVLYYGNDNGMYCVEHIKNHSQGL